MLQWSVEHDQPWGNPVSEGLGHGFVANLPMAGVHARNCNFLASEVPGCDTRSL